MRFNPGCECCTPVSGCCGCAVRPASYDITIAGISGTLTTVSAAFEECTDCAEANGDYTIPEVADCSYFFTEDICTGGSASEGDHSGIGLHLYCDATYWWLEVIICYTVLDAPIGEVYCETAYYKKTRASWSCLGANTLDYDRTEKAPSHTINCTFPATLTVTP